MKLKKKAKIILLLIILIVTGALVFLSYKTSNDKPKIKETKVISSIDEYDYQLKETRNKTYQNMFSDLEKILKKENNEEEYVRQISKMFIYDFYTLEDKVAKTDVGGIDFIYDPIVNDFLTKSENTYYKYLESNIYGDREQVLPVVDTVEINSLENIQFSYQNNIDKNAYKINVSWTYTSSDFDKYQKQATMIFIHNKNKLDLVELKGALSNSVGEE